MRRARGFAVWGVTWHFRTGPPWTSMSAEFTRASKSAVYNVDSSLPMLMIWRSTWRTRYAERKDVGERENSNSPLEHGLPVTPEWMYNAGFQLWWPLSYFQQPWQWLVHLAMLRAQMNLTSSIMIRSYHPTITTWRSEMSATRYLAGQAGAAHWPIAGMLLEEVIITAAGAPAPGRTAPHDYIFLISE